MFIDAQQSNSIQMKRALLCTYGGEENLKAKLWKLSSCFVYVRKLDSYYLMRNASVLDACGIGMLFLNHHSLLSSSSSRWLTAKWTNHREEGAAGDAWPEQRSICNFGISI